MNHLHNYLREKIREVASATLSSISGSRCLQSYTHRFSVSVRQYACVFSEEISHRCKNRRAKGRRIASRWIRTETTEKTR